MGFHSKNSSDLDVGRRPMLESDEFLLWNPIVMEIWRCENTYFSPKCSTTWDDASMVGVSRTSTLEAQLSELLSGQVHHSSLFGTFPAFLCNVFVNTTSETTQREANINLYMQHSCNLVLFAYLLAPKAPA